MLRQPPCRHLGGALSLLGGVAGQHHTPRSRVSREARHASIAPAGLLLSSARLPSSDPYSTAARFACPGL
jgi:hypothetical protein